MKSKKSTKPGRKKPRHGSPVVMRKVMKTIESSMAGMPPVGGRRKRAQKS